jgi:LacI family transcriptional regulator
MSVTMSDIAARAGTTVGVVSVTLNGAKSKTLRVSQATRDRVLLAAAELGYRRDPRASALVTGRNYVLGLMLPHLHSFTVPDPFYSLVTAGVAAAASRLGYNLMLYTAVAEEESERALEMIDRRIDGLILVLPPDDTPIVQECRRQGISTVAILQTAAVCDLTVNSSDYEGGCLAVRHLVALGHRRIAHLMGKRDIHTSAERYRAYEDVLRSAGISLIPEFVREGHFDRRCGYEATLELFNRPHEERPTAIFAANDLSAHGALDALAELGMQVPTDVSVVGYDDTWYASITNPPLTSVQLHTDELGKRAVEILVAAIEGSPFDPHPILPVVLTVRQSTAPPRT